MPCQWQQPVVLPTYTESRGIDIVGHQLSTFSSSAQHAVVHDHTSQQYWHTFMHMQDATDIAAHVAGPAFLCLMSFANQSTIMLQYASMCHHSNLSVLSVCSATCTYTVPLMSVLQSHSGWFLHNFAAHYCHCWFPRSAWSPQWNLLDKFDLFRDATTPWTY